MKNDKIFDALTDIDDELLKEAETVSLEGIRPRRRWMYAAAAALLIAAGVMAVLAGKSPAPDPSGNVAGTEVQPGAPQRSAAVSPFVLCDIKYPAVPQRPLDLELNGTGQEEAYEAWFSYMCTRWLTQGDQATFAPFARTISRTMLSGSASENQVCSPANLYVALAMLAETADGNTRAQIMNALGSKDISAARTTAKALWDSVYLDDGFSKSVLSSSIWLRDDAAYNTQTLELLAENYKTASFKGKMGSAEYNNAVSAWLAEESGGLLGGEGLTLNADTAAALFSSIYFKSNWTQHFLKEATQDAVFHAPDGDKTVPFMYDIGSREYFYSDDFSAIALATEDRSQMWLVLPDEGKTPQDVLTGNDVFDLVTNAADWERKAFPMVDLYLPRFDISCSSDISDGLKKLGITDVFSPDDADLTGLSDQIQPLYISQARQDARVTVDEDGVTAASAVEFLYAGSALPTDRVEFRLDRPFLFFITNKENVIIFAGIVAQP